MQLRGIEEGFSHFRGSLDAWIRDGALDRYKDLVDAHWGREMGGVYFTWYFGIFKVSLFRVM